MKKLLLLILALAMILSMGACAGTDNGKDSAPDGSSSNNSQPTDPSKPTDPSEPPAPVIYNGMTAAQLDAIPGINAETFQNAMDAGWNFGWEGPGTIEYNATKVDFDGLLPDESPVWRVGVSSMDNAAAMNAGWGVGLWTSGSDAMAFMYAKVDVPETINQFRVWAVGNKSEHWSGSGAIRAVALYKNEAGEYVKTVLLPVEDTFVGNMTTTLHDDGTVRFHDATWNMPDTLDDCMLIYDPTELLGKEDVIIFIEGIGIGDVLGDEYTEAAEGVANGAVMPEMVIIKRVMFLAG